MSDLWTSFDLEEVLDRNQALQKGAGHFISFDVSGTDIAWTSTVRDGASITPAVSTAEIPDTQVQSEEKSEQVAENSKTFKVVLVGGDERIIVASDTVETPERLSFMGSVEGHTNYGTEVVASFRNEDVVEYSLIPTAEVPRVGAYTYRITFSGPDAKTQDIVADRLLLEKSATPGSGQFTLVTGAQGKAVTEYSIGEMSVFSIRRVTEQNDDAVVPAQTTPDENVSV